VELFRAILAEATDKEFCNGERPMNVSELKSMKINELTQMAKKLKIEG